MNCAVIPRQLFHPEVGRVGEIELEGLAGLVAIDGLFSGRHQLAGAQQDGDVGHLAVRDGLALQKTLKGPG